MYRNPGTNSSLGFGVTQGNLPQAEYEEVPDPNAGLVAQALNERPLAKFLATAGMTIVAAGISGSLVRKAGVKGLRSAAKRAASDPDSLSAGFVKEYRKVQSILDDYGGIHRTRHADTMDIQGGKVVHFDDPTKDVTWKSDSFVFNQGERERMRSMGGQLPAEWTMRDEMQQRLVSSARRLPYELPAVYVTQRTFTDKLLDEGPDEPVNWRNPVDVIGDFAQQSIKNIAFAFTPFEGGVGAAQHGWRKALTSSVNQAAPKAQRAAHGAIIDLDASLKLIGHEASDIVARGVAVSGRSMGAMSTSISQTASRQQSVTQTLHSMRHGEKGFAGWLERVRTGEEVFGPLSQMREIARSYKKNLPDRVDALDDMYNQIYGGGSKFDQMVSSVKNLQGENFTDGSFYQSFAAAEYKKIVGRRLSDHGVDKRISQEFADAANFTLPFRPGQQSDISNRVMFGKRAHGVIDQGNMPTWNKAFENRVEPVFRGYGRQISESIEDVIKQADKEFLARKPHIDQIIGRAWGKASRDVIGPEMGRNLGTRRAAFGDFGADMTDSSAEFMVRRSAERMGIRTITPGGERISTADLKSQLNRFGLDSRNKQQLRSFLVEQGDISKPWNPTGRGILGLRPMSIQEGLDKKIFGQDMKDAEQVAKSIARSDWDANILDRIQMGDVYTTARGNVADFSPIRRGYHRFMDVMATEFEVPVLHFNPLQMFGYGARREISQRGAIQFTAGRQPFTGAAGEGADGFLWFQKGFGSKGRAAALRVDSERGGVTADFLDGLYRPFTPDQSMTGRALHLAAGDNVGRAHVGRSGARGRLASMFDYDEYQPSALGGTIRRMRGRRDDIRKPAVLAEKYLSGAALPDDPALLAEANRNLFNHLRTASLSRNVANSKAVKPDSLLGRMMMKEGLDDPTSIFDLDARGVRAAMRKFSREDPESLGITDEAMADTLRKAQKSLGARADKLQDISTLDQPLHRMGRTNTLNQRIDEERMAIMRYIGMREGLKQPGASVSDFRRQLNEVIQKVSSLQGTGAISAREAAESRAAIGSIQASFTSLRTYSSEIPAQDQVNMVVQNLIRPGGKAIDVDDAMRQILDDTANYGISGRAAGKIRKYLAPSRYQFDGTEFSPFGQAQSVLTPTFGTAFGRNPLKATLSAAGVRTWDDPESFSGAGIPVSHIFDRMNRATQTLGLGIDSAKYRGPIDMFNRGMIGKRVLPLVAGGTTAMTVDRTVGGFVHSEEDAYGERVYKPLVMGAIGGVGLEAHAMITGMIPGGMDYTEKREELLEGEVAVRRGRWWPFGNTPWRGGQVDYYRPSWYRRLQSGYQYTDQTFGSPMERLMFGYDFSPLRSLDPYRFEEKHMDDRPYPVSGDYFTGPWGPATGALNMTVGRLLKPRREYHQEELQWEMSRFQQVGAHGMAPPSTGMAMPGEPTIAGAIGMGVSGTSPLNAVGGYEAAAGTPAYLSGTRQARQDVFGQAGQYSAAAAPWYTAPPEYPFRSDMQSPTARTPSNIMMAAQPLSPGGLEYQLSESAYQMQEYAGIYGFAFGAGREALGLGKQDFQRERPILAQASQAYGSSRQFWDLNLGGLGDFPTPVQGMGGLEASELVRRFIPKPRTGQDWVNPLRNTMGREHSWLPGDDYFTNFHTGDPYTEISEGEMRLPGQGYERFNELHSDETGRYGRIDRFKILADVAPHSNEFRSLAAEMANSTGYEREVYEETMARVDEMTSRHEFTPYEHKYEAGFGGAAEAWERFRHMDTYFHKKLMPDVTAIEDWERNNIFGSNFPEWQKPIESFVKPSIYKATDKNAMRAGIGLGIFGALFGATPRARAVGGLIGGITGAGASMFGKGYEAITGERYIPAARRQEMAVEEHTDILSYTRAMRGFNLAEQAGNFKAAEQFKTQMKSTMYGADLYDSTPEELARAIPKRKREHFEAMINAPEEERERILSTAGRLERRIYQAQWGMRVERRPDLGEYFEQHELPGEGWCVLGDTELRMADGSFRVAEDIEVGDAILNSQGKDRIIAVHKRFAKDEKLTKLGLGRYGYEFSATNNHIVFVSDENQRVVEKKIDEVEEGDYLVTPRLKFREIPAGARAHTTSNDSMFLYGLYLAEGHIHYDQSRKNPYKGIGFTFSQAEEHLTQQCARILQRLYPENTVRIQKRNRPSGDSLNVNITSTKAAKQFNAQFGRFCDGKFIGYWAWNWLNIEKALYLLSGVYWGDGSKTENRIIISMANKILIEQLWVLACAVGIPATIRERKNGDRKPQWSLSIPKQWKSIIENPKLYTSPEFPSRTKYGNTIITEDWIMQRVKSKEEEIISDYVYDFTVENVHMYCTVMGSYHNSGWDPRMGMENVEIKMLQQQGLNTSQMGYYPQQVRQANLINPSFPGFGQGTQNPRAQLENLMSARGMAGDVREIRTPFPGVRVQVNSGV